MYNPIPFFEFVLIFLNVVYLFETYLDYRNHLKYKTLQLPAKLANLVKEDVFIKSQKYNLDKSTFGFIEGFISHIMSLAILWYGVLPYIWYLSEQLIVPYGVDTQSTFGEIVQSCLFIFIYSVFSYITSLPFSLYRTFVIEENHGFNKMTFSLFITDTIKTTLLFIVLTPPILAGIIYLIKWGGDYFYLYVCGFMLFLQFFFITIYPVLIQPLFNKVEPLPKGPLREKIEALASQTDFPLTQLYQIDGSKRSGHSNAYFYGFWKNKRIVLYDTLIKQVSELEVVAVLAHELGHYFLNHTIYNLIIGQIQITILFFLFGKVMYTEELFGSFGFAGTPTLIGLMLFSYIYSPVDHITSFCMNMYIRYNEFQADAFSVKLGYGKELIDGLVRLQTENLSTMDPDYYYSTYHYSHPPLVERLEAIDSLLKKTT
jgi:STE24 endopeptidase